MLRVPMGLAERRALYEKIEAVRGRHLLALFLSSRSGAPALMASDVLPALFRQIRALPADEKGVDILIESNGGQADVAIRFNDVLREVRRDVHVLVPRNAFSAATMLALGGTRIMMHPLSCLGPIDPQLRIQRADGSFDQVGAEDIKAFVDFLNDEVRITDQAQVAAVFTRLFEDVRPIQLGVARRASMRSLAIAKELLLRHAESHEAHTKVETIAERLAGGYHAHGHPISPTEARAMGLPVDVASPDLADLMWSVLMEADGEMETETPLQPYAHMMRLWRERMDRWKSELAAAAATAAPGAPTSAPLAQEIEALKISLQIPIHFSLTATMGLVESVRCASRCDIALHYIGGVTPKGGELSAGPGAAVWKAVD